MAIIEVIIDYYKSPGCPRKKKKTADVMYVDYEQSATDEFPVRQISECRLCSGNSLIAHGVKSNDSPFCQVVEKSVSAGRWA